MHRYLSLVASLAACGPAPKPGPPPGPGPGSGAFLASPHPLLVTTGDCLPPYCTGNSPVIAGIGLWDLNLDHHPNAQGFVLLGLTQQGQFYDLDIKDGELIALKDRRSTARDNIVYRGTTIKGSTLWLQQGRSQYGLNILDVFQQVREVVAARNLLFTYKFQWGLAYSPLPGTVDHGIVHTDGGDQPAREPVLNLQTALPMCPAWGGTVGNPHMLPGWTPPAAEGSWPASDTAWDEGTVMSPFTAVLFEGDRIDAVHRVLDPRTADDRWFNIGCARHTLAKMRLSRNTLHTVASRDWRDVQAVLKMLSADYCGTGTAETVAGTPLVWQQWSQIPTVRGLPPPPPSGMTYHQPPANLEARWDEYGAICIDDPRSFVHPAVGLPTDRNQLILQSCASPDPSPDPIAARPLRSCKVIDPLTQEYAQERVTSANWGAGTATP